VPSPLPTRDTEALIGPQKQQLGGPGPRAFTINNDDWNRAITLLFAALEEIGETDGTTVGSLWEAISGLGGGEISVAVYAEQGSAPAAVANKVKVYAKDNGGVSALYARLDDGTEINLSEPALGELTVTSLSASATLTAVSQLVLVDTTAGAVVLTLPAAASAAGVRYIIKQIAGANTITLDPAGTDQVEAGGAGTNYLLPDSGAVGAWSVFGSGSAWWRSDHIPVVTLGALSGLRLAEQGGDPSATANEGKLYTKDVGGVTHFFGILSDGTIIRFSGTSTAPAALGRAASAGSLGSMANADHVHDEGVLIAPTSMSSNTTLTDAMQVLLIDTTSGALNLTLPTPVSSSPRHWLLKKINAGASDITLIRGGSENIEGAGANKKLPQSEATDLPSWTLLRDNSGNFWIF